MKKLKSNMRYNDYSPRLIETINGEEPVILNDKLGKEYCEIHIDDIFVVEDNRALALKGVEILEDLKELSNTNDDENKDNESLNANDDENKDDESLNTNDDENKDEDLDEDKSNDDENKDDDKEEPKKTSSRKTTKK